jgi:hypothetical protein
MCPYSLSDFQSLLRRNFGRLHVGFTWQCIETVNRVNVPLRTVIASIDFGHDFQFEDSRKSTQISLAEVSSD